MLSWEEPTGIIKVLALHRVSLMMLISLPQVIRPWALHSWRGSWDTWCSVSPQISRSSGRQGSEIPEAEAGAKFRNQRGCCRLLFKILFLMRFNLDNSAKSSKVTLCSHLGLNIWWCARSEECYQTPRVPPALPEHSAAPAVLLQVPLVAAPSW